MKEKIFSVALLIGVLAFVTINTVILSKEIEEITDRVAALEPSGYSEGAMLIYDEFKSRSKYMSLTVSHEDLRDIEDRFVEMIGYISVGDEDNARVTKDRLTRSLEHLRRLSGFNIDAII